jgi:hypothetical protein
MTKVANTGCPITILILQNEPNLVRRRRIAKAVATRRYANITVLPDQKNEPKRTQTYTNWAIWANYLSPCALWLKLNFSVNSVASVAK